ncbi:MAG: hypothetical protein K1W13_05825 [Lachnospiraceae bacterium]
MWKHNEKCLQKYSSSFIIAVGRNPYSVFASDEWNVGYDLEMQNAKDQEMVKEYCL